MDHSWKNLKPLSFRRLSTRWFASTLSLLFVSSFSPLTSSGRQDPLSAQQRSPRDEQAVSILQRALTAAGGAAVLAASQDFTASGTITYFWAGETISGPATALGRHSDQFRLDAQLPQGLRSLIVDGAHGKLNDVPGPVSEIPYLNAVSVGILTFPYPGIAAALADPYTLAAYVGTAEISGRQVQQIRLRRRPSLSLDHPTENGLSSTVLDYFMDAQTGLVLRIADSTNPIDPIWKDYPHEIDYADYKMINGLNVPTLVTEKFMGNAVWEFRLSDIVFNIGLTDSKFAVQVN